MYVVAGVSGNTGRVVAEALLAKNQPVRALVRDEEKGKVWAERGAEVAILSLEDTEALTNALRGAAGAYLIVPPPGSDATGVFESRGQIAESITRAVTQSGVKHVVALSSIGAQHPSGTGIVMVVHHLEERLRGLSTPITFLRAGYFMENWAATFPSVSENGIVPTFIAPTKLKVPMIATKDIGMIAVEALLKPPQGHQTIELAGPQDYAPADVAATLSSIVGKEVRVESAPLEAMPKTLASFGMSSEMAGLFQELTAAINSGYLSWEGSGTRFVRGTTTLEGVFRPMLS